MNRKMAEMKEGRESAGNIKLRLVAFLAVKRQLLFKKLHHLQKSAGVSSLKRRGLDSVIDGQRVQKARCARKQLLRNSRPVSRNDAGNFRACGNLCLCKRICPRK